MANDKRRDRRADGSSGSATFMISAAAELAGMHAQTLRTYDRLGLVTPQRTSGGGRRYSADDVERLREIQRLSQDEGVNLAGIKRIIELSDEVAELQRQIEDLGRRLAHGGRRGELVPVTPATSVVLWQPRRRRPAD
ncbi:heat shock protein transcriptional repressor HspR [Gordonia sp. VNK21]|uniref:heat shock protein transcriptional repressor HspR n=1 Tax=Gordonia sp. VNK21 TaxID=3382483 RepID=UPI0038D4AD65